ncbi:MAG: 1-deoxy-D-xylulose-5-phosphate reductoisomerase, partial [Candidatus Latescibacteria bacterium]|nr:1-deoxy-D-xylulose-5-phosphate reductoisomerase [Candidatus Latescibacterota bacterium]
DETDAQRLRELLGGNTEVLSGAQGLEAVATHDAADVVVGSLSGGVGVKATLAAVEAGRDVALANKEVLVLAGHLVRRAAERSGAALLPMDSEISAIWQCLEGQDKNAVARVLLTASGGPFKNASTEEMERVTPTQALDHPTWDMGDKVTIDSATLMNKGFEIHEIHWLFDVPLDAIEVVVHPQSILHSMVEFDDGAVIAQLGAPDMTVPIQFALSSPQRLPTNADRLDFAEIGALTFEAPQTDRFAALGLARDAAMEGGTMPAVLSGADEAAVKAFLDGRISFTAIPEMVADAMEAHETLDDPDLDTVIVAESWAAEWVEGRL